ncbi:TonB-dependent siderophore receptor [Rubrivivax gelatinosus]|nr:TonB-dependent siderophore receptor [Rubrivivax gelatinosus]
MRGSRDKESEAIVFTHSEYRKEQTMRPRHPAAASARRRARFLYTPLVCAIAQALVAAVPALLATGAAKAADVAPAHRHYDIPAGPLEAALGRFGREAGIALSYPSELTAGRSSPGLQGRYGVAEALALLLQDSGLAAVERAGGWTLVKRPEAAGAAADGLPAITARGRVERESATGPLSGYAAQRSASATKTDTALLETPQSIAIVGAEQIADLKAISVAQALAYTPGVITDAGYANSYDVVFSRGFRLQDGSGVLRDGLKLGGSGWATGQQETYGMERLELLKGAASVLYGAAAPGGVLNVVTKLPQPGHVNELLVEAGNYGHRAAAADLGTSFSDTLSARLVLLARDADTAVDHVPNDSRYIAPSLRWTPDADTSLTLLAHHTDRRTAYIWGLPVEGSLVSTAWGKLPPERFVGEPGFDRQDTRQSSFGWLLSRRLAPGVTLEHGLRWIDSENHVRFSNLRSRDADDPRVYKRLAIDELETTRGLSADTRVQADFDAAGMRHAVVAGFDYSRHHIGSEWEYASLGSLNLYDPVYGSQPGSFAPQGNDQERQRRLGLYLQDQVRIGAVTALAGVRRDEVRSEIGGATEKTGATTGRLGLVWEVAAGVAPFASWSQSFEPVSGTDNDGERYKPTRGRQLELGLRWQHGDFMASAAAFHLVQSNVQKMRIGLEKAVQTGEARSRGIELEAKGPVARRVQLIASYAYTDAEVTKSEDPSEIGDPVSYQPRHQAALWTRVDDWLAPGLQAGLGARYTGRTEDWNGSGSRVPGYTTLDALLGYATGPWTLRLNVNNLADKETLLCSSGWCTYGDGRRLTASMAYRW